MSTLGFALAVSLVSVFAVSAQVPEPKEMRGPFPIMSTPYFEDGSVDYETLQREAKWVSDSGSADWTKYWKN